MKNLACEFSKLWTSLVGARIVQPLGVIVMAASVLGVLGGPNATRDSSEVGTNTVKGHLEETIRIGANSRLVVVIGGKRSEYGPGDEVHVAWTDGVLYINDQQVRPVPRDSTAPRISLSEAKRMYGAAPVVLQYVRDHGGQGTDEQLWNAGIERHDALLSQADTEALSRYSYLVNGDVSVGRASISPSEAAESVRQDLLKKTDIVSSVAIEPSGPDSLVRVLDIRWKGFERVPEYMTLVPNVEPRVSIPKLVSREDFEQFYMGELRSLGLDKCCTVLEFEEGGIRISGGRQSGEKEPKE